VAAGFLQYDCAITNGKAGSQDTGGTRSWTQFCYKRMNNKKFWEGHLFEILEPNLIELNLKELTLTLFN